MNKSAAIANLATMSGLTWFSRRLAPWNGVVVLNYHRVGIPGSSLFDHGLWSASPDEFDWQVRWLKKNYDLITPSDFPSASESKRHRYVAITFDDGYRDNYEAAYSVLRSHNVRATFFITTGFIDNIARPWWDAIAWMVRSSRRRQVHLERWAQEPIDLDPPNMTKAIRQLLRIYKSLPNEKAQEYLSELPAHLNETPPSSELFQSLWMTWDMIREMKASGMCVGGHTNTHPVLSKLVPEDQADEIRTCARRLREELGAPMECFSYPVGHRDSFDGTTREFLKAEGCQYGFSYYGGIGQLRPTDSLDIPRFPVETETSRNLFALMVSMPTTYLAMRRY